jgi:exodeoxyribonuclease V alpha subunit
MKSFAPEPSPVSTLPEHGPDPIVVEGHIERVRYHNPDTRFTVARFRETRTGGTFTILAILPDPDSGERYRLQGFWQRHRRFGHQFRVVSAEPVQPSDVESLRQYLASGIMPGVGSKTAEKLVACFGSDTADVLENAPQRLTEVPGIGPRTAARLAAQWQHHHALRRLVEILRKHDVPAAHAIRLHRRYGTEAENILRSDPFRIAQDLPRIGFDIADRMLIEQGVPCDDPLRVRACLLNLLRERAEAGDVCVPWAELVQRLERRFRIIAESAETALEQLQTAGEVVVETPSQPAVRVVYLKALHVAENVVCRRLEALLAGPPPRNRSDTVFASSAHSSPPLSPEQQAVLSHLLGCRAAVISGGPGTGKTTLIHAVANLLESRGEAVALAAPTGRAARRLSEICGRPAFTIHKLLGYLPSEDRFEHDRDQPLSIDAVIVDEASMLDILLSAHLLEAVPVSARLILVGDVYQLPPVGPGAVLSELIESGRLPHFTLNQVFRQAMESRITVNAHRIRRGEAPLFGAVDPDENPGDFYFVELRHPPRILQTVVELCTRQIPDAFGFDPIRDIQVLTPMHKGELGTHRLNQVLQRRLNPDAAGPDDGRFRIGDKVMQLTNNYRKEVYNGDIGVIADLDTSNDIVSVDFAGRLVDYRKQEMDELSLAYAMTVHKSQGSEYPAVILLLTTQHYPMLQRNLLYTAITRGRRLVVLIGMQKAMQIALSNDAPHRRRSGLLGRLQENPPKW